MSAANPKTVRKAPACREDLARREADALIKGFLEQLTGFHRRRKLQPQHKAAGWPTDPRARREVLVDCARHPLDIVGEDAPDTAQVLIVGTGSQEFGERRLWQHGTAQRERRLGIEDALQMPAGDDPA